MISEDSQDYAKETFKDPTITAKEVIRGKRSRTVYEKLDYVKRENDRIAIMNSIQTQNQSILDRESADEIDLFFKSIAMSVKKLPAKGKTEAKLKILSTVAQLEDKYLVGDTETQPPQVMIQTPTQIMFEIPSSHADYNCMSLSNSPSIITSQEFEP